MITRWFVISATFLILNLTQRVAAQDNKLWCATDEQDPTICSCCWYILGIFPVYARVNCDDVPALKRGQSSIIRQPILITAINSAIASFASWVGVNILVALLQFIASIRD